MATRSISVWLKANTADFRAQMGQASKSLEDLAAKSDKTGKVAQTGLGRLAQSAQLQRQAWSTVSTGLLATSVAAGAMVGVAVKKFADFDQAMSGVQAATHETAANMELLRAAAIKAGADTQYSATDAAEAIEALAKAGISTADILSGGLAGSMSLAAAGGLAVGDAAEIAATALTQFKLSGSDVGHVADLLAAGAGKAQGDVSDLGMALKQSGLVANQTGLSIDETTGALSAFASAGLIGSDAGTSFKSMLQRLTPQSAEAQKLMDQLGISAYDAGGNFVGLAAFAGNLQSALKDLTPEQRNSALATIFGSDAVRAASVIYDQGATGVQSWIDSVDDAGYAASTAAARTDNLKGDIERLSGSLETVFIKSAGGANGLLRSLAQQAEAAVNAFGELPDPVQQGALGLLALVAAGGGAAGMFMKIVPAILDTRTAMRDLNVGIPVLSTLSQSASLAQSSFSSLRVAVGDFGTAFSLARGVGESSMSALATASATSMSGIKSAASGVGSALLGAFGGPVGLAVAGLTVAIGMYAQGQQEAAAFTAALTATLNEQTGALTQSSRAAVAKQLQDKGVFDDARDLGISLDTVTQAAMGNAEAMSELAHKSGEVSSDALNNNLIPSLDSNFRKMQNVESVTKSTAEQVEASKSAWDNQSSAVDSSTDSQDDNAASTAAATSAIDDQTSALQDLVKAQSDAAGIALSLSDAQIGYQKSLDDATASIEKNGRTLDINTEAGRSNRGALDDVASSGWDLIKSMSAIGASQSDLQGSMATTRADFIRTATQMGMNRAAAEQLADQYGLIPSSIKTSAELNDRASGPLAALKQRLLTIPNGTATVYLKDNASYRIDSIKQKIQQLDGTWATVGVQTVTVGSGRGALVGSALATGGPVSGPGTGTSDTAGIFALSNGEHVLTASDVQKLGGQSGVYRFREALQAGRVTGYAAGGAVPREARVSASSFVAPRVSVAAPSMEGMVLTGSLDINGAIVPIIDGRIQRQQRDFARRPR